MLNKTFETVERYKCKASIMIEGLSGYGKSGLALLFAVALADYTPEKVFAIDTENKSLNLFEGLPTSTGSVFKDFKKVDLTSEDGFSPSNYLELRTKAVKQGAEVVISDSISHAWQYQGGILTMVAEYAAKSGGRDKYAPWNDPTISHEKNLLLDLIRSPECHVITTVRVKEKFMPETGTDGKTKIKSLGEQQIMQDDLKYEPDLLLHAERAGNGQPGNITTPIVTVIKSRYPMFTKDQKYEITSDLIESLRIWLAEGADPTELLEKQRQDYITGVAEYLKENPTKEPIWQLLKDQEKCGNTKLTDLPLLTIKKLLNKLVI